MKKIIVEFGNLEKELKTKGFELYHHSRINSMVIKDSDNKMYEVEKYFHASYLDKLISNKSRVTFNQVLNRNLQYFKNEHMERLV